ncbi:hypothetical protein FRC02_004920 [Tulasnella sp. 418]|nr:hypothetical protein FRC02_004920 [Tulasnella sp. 418]
MSSNAQPLKSFKTRVSETIALFQPELLKTPDGVEKALATLTVVINSCQNGDSRFTMALVESLVDSEIGTLEYIFAKDSNAARIILSALLHVQVPDSTPGEDSPCFRALLRLSDFYLRLPPTIDIPNYPRVAKAYQVVTELRKHSALKIGSIVDPNITLVQPILKFYLDTLSAIRLDIVAAYEYTPPIPDEILIPSPGSPTSPTTSLGPMNSTFTDITSKNQVTDLAEDYLNAPSVRPVALFDNTDEKLGPWIILFSSRGYTHWKRLGAADAANFKIVHRKITELSFGYFSNDNQSWLAGQDNEVPIYSARLTADRHLVYQIECGFPPSVDISQLEEAYETQMIRIFGIYNQTQLDRPLWAALARHSLKLGREYRLRCRRREVARKSIRGHLVTPPITFGTSSMCESQESGDNDLLNNLGSDDRLEAHKMLASEKYIPYDRHIFEACRNNEELTSVFAVSREEEKIIYHPSSAMVIGRSGTGKTTTMIFKMIALEKAAANSHSPLRQVFVTQSSVLAKSVADFYAKSKQRSIPVPPVENFSILELVEEVVEAESSLPSRWSELKGSDFPLFVTYDQLCRLLQADIASNFGTTRLGDKKMLVTFNMFRRDIWPHFNQQLKSGLSASLVWSEFMSVIKGSEEALCSGRGYVDRLTYETMRSKAGLTSVRARIYDLFESYLRQKRDLRWYDHPERTHVLLRALSAVGLRGDLIDSLYVDEVQDNLLLDAGLLRKLCRSPHGMFWAGDSAQTIAVGSTFRFDELRSYLYRAEMSDPSVKDKSRKPVHPQEFQLSVNYRSHGGIVNAAASLVEMILKFFPASIDKLSKEKSKVNGPKPVILSPISGNRLQFENFLFGDTESRVEFGAEQVILVRNEEVQKQLQAQIGDLPLVLTLYESKGLEFNDVLLYNFFLDSPASASDWRVILNCIHNRSSSAPVFDELRHAAIQTELKFLYVGLTRARDRVWIWDSSEKMGPIMDFWISRNLTTVCPPSKIDGKLAVRSSQHVWKKRACALFRQQLYRHSISAFLRAGMQLESLIAVAFQAKCDAENLTANHSGRRTAWEVAAKKFDRCQELSPHNALQQRRLCVLAAEAYAEVPAHHQAATFFELVDNYSKAVLHYRQAGSFDNAIEVIQKHRHEIDAVLVKKTESVAKVHYTKQGDLKKARQLFKSPAEHAEFLDTLGLDDMLTEVLIDMKEYDRAAEIVLRKGEEIKAAHLQLQSSNVESRKRAVKFFLENLWKHFTLDSIVLPIDSTIEEAMKIAHSLQNVEVLDRYELVVFASIRMGDHQKLSSVIPHLLAGGRKASALLALDHLIRLCYLPKRSLVSADNNRGQSNALNKTEAAVLPLDEVENIVKTYATYSHELRAILARLQESVNDPQVQKLLHFRPLQSVIDNSAHEYTILHCEPQVLHVSTYAKTVMNSTDGVVVNQEDMQRVLLRSLSDRYNGRIRALYRLLEESAHSLRPCPLYAVGDPTCVQNDGVNCPNDHVDSTTALSTFPTRVRIHLQVISLLDSMMPDYKAASSDDMAQTFGKKGLQRVWLDRLFDCLHPPSSIIGSLASLEKQTISGHPSWLPAVQAWLKSRLFLLKPWDSYFRFYMTSVLNISLLAFSLDYANCTSYSYEAGCSRHYRGLERLLFRQEGKATVVRDVFHCLRGLRPDSLHMGVMSVRHIASRPELTVDIHALTTYIERIITLSTFRLGPFSHRQSRNELILPRSWLTYGLLYTHSWRRMSGFVPIETLIEAIEDVLWRLEEPPMNDKGQVMSFYYQGYPLAQIGPYHATSYAIGRLFSAKLCRALVILGCNSNAFIRGRVLNIFQSFQYYRTQDLPSRFFGCRSWQEATRALTQSSLNSSPDDVHHLILLQAGTRHTSPLQDVKTVFCRDYEDAVSQMDLSRLFVPNLLVALPQSSQISGSQQFPPLSEPDPVDEPDPEHVNLNSIKESRAANLIADAYKRHLERQKSPRTGSHFFDNCLSVARADDAKTLDRRYTKLLLGPVPHLLLWLEEAMKSCTLALTQQSQILAESSHEAYDNAFTMIARLKRLRRDLQELSKVLGPHSPFHSTGTIGKLRDQLKPVQTLRERVELLLPKMSDNVLEDLRLAEVGLSIERARPRDEVEEGV